MSSTDDITRWRNIRDLLEAMCHERFLLVLVVSDASLCALGSQRGYKSFNGI
jgi:hypothetical protein